MSNQVIEIQALTLDAARAEISSHVPQGKEVLSERVISDGKTRSIRCVADTIEKALTDARSKIPTGATGITEAVTDHRAEVIRVEAFDEEAAKSSVQNQLRSMPATITSVKMTKQGSRGFLGIGKTPNQYEVSVLHQAVVQVSYALDAKIVIEIGDPPKIQCGLCGAERPVSQMRSYGERAKQRWFCPVPCWAKRGRVVGSHDGTGCQYYLEGMCVAGSDNTCNYRGSDWHACFVYRGKKEGPHVLLDRLAGDKTIIR
jgi:hypothetical protein